MDNRKTRLIIVGGFLGAGKTTGIVSIAKLLLAEGKKTGIVTNDQGSSLVDTEYLKSQGLHVLEVTGGCFCCNFDEFTSKLSQMSDEQYPDYILAEPVGSCTDLVATIMKPMGRQYNKKFSLSPLSIVVDPKRLLKVMREAESPFPDEINYLFRKQIEEADIIALNKTDTLSRTEAAEMLEYLQKAYPAAIVLPISAKENKGIEAWLSKLSEYPLSLEKSSLNIIYDTYAAAEADLGWLNLTAALNSGKSFDANSFMENLAADIKQKLASVRKEIAHLKIYTVGSSDFAKLSCVSTGGDIEFDKTMALQTNEASLVINIRAAVEPELLKNITESNLSKTAASFCCTVEGIRTEAFRPGYPKPVHRL